MEELSLKVFGPNARISFQPYAGYYFIFAELPLMTWHTFLKQCRMRCPSSVQSLVKSSFQRTNATPCLSFLSLNSLLYTIITLNANFTLTLLVPSWALLDWTQTLLLQPCRTQTEISLSVMSHTLLLLQYCLRKNPATCNNQTFSDAFAYCCWQKVKVMRKLLDH